jgi:HlyD family secretion protein
VSATDDFLGMRPGSRRRRMLQWVLVALAAVAVIVLVGRFVNGGEATHYTTVAVVRQDLQASLTGSGALLPVGQRAITADVGGTVTEVLVHDGERIAKGQLLARLDPTALAQNAGAALNLIGAREAALSDAVAADREARDQLRRFNQIRARSNNTVPSDREMGQARDAARAAAERQRDAVVELAAARAMLAERQAQQAATQIVAPADGLVIRRHIAVGQTVAAHDQTLFEIAATPTHLQMQVLVDRDAAQALRPGSPAQVSGNDDPKRAFSASVALVRPARSADETQSIVLLDVNNAAGTLRPGMMATARIDMGSRKNALIVPDDALEFAAASDATAGDAPADDAVYVLNDQGAPRRVSVTVNGGDGARQAVDSPGLSAGMPVITGLR